MAYIPALPQEGFFAGTNVYTGSHDGMQMRIVKQEGAYVAWVYPEPMNFSKTPDGEKRTASFPFNEEGRAAAAAWLGEQYEQAAQDWHKLRWTVGG